MTDDGIRTALRAMRPAERRVLGQVFRARADRLAEAGGAESAFWGALAIDVAATDCSVEGAVRAMSPRSRVTLARSLSELRDERAEATPTEAALWAEVAALVAGMDAEESETMRRWEDDALGLPGVAEAEDL